MIRSMRHIAALFAGLLALAVVAGCGPKSIAGIKGKAQKYDGQTVTITARVIDTKDIPLTSTDYYKVTDDSGELWVLTTRGVPLKGMKYRIEGRLERPAGSVAGILLGDYILRESSRQEVREN